MHVRRWGLAALSTLEKSDVGALKMSLLVARDKSLDDSFAADVSGGMDVGMRLPAKCR